MTSLRDFGMIKKKQLCKHPCFFNYKSKQCVHSTRLFETNRMALDIQIRNSCIAYFLEHTTFVQ